MYNADTPFGDQIVHVSLDLASENCISTLRLITLGALDRPFGDRSERRLYVVIEYS